MINQIFETRCPTTLSMVVFCSGLVVIRSAVVVFCSACSAVEIFCSAPVGSCPVCSTSIPSLSISAWTWPSVPPPVPPPLHRPPALYRSVWKPLLGGGLCHESMNFCLLTTRGHSLTTLTLALHYTTSTLHWTAFPIIHCTNDTQLISLITQSHMLYKPCTSSL